MPSKPPGSASSAPPRCSGLGVASEQLGQGQSEILHRRCRRSATTLPTKEERVDPVHGEDRGFRPLLEHLLNQGRCEAKAARVQGFALADPELPAIFQEAGLQGRPQAAELARQHDA